MNITDARYRDIVARLHGQNYRLTPQRLAVVRIVARSQEHPTVDQIYAQVREQFPTTSLATVYKTIAVLKEMGEILELDFSDGNRYDGQVCHWHPHVLCTRCGRIDDLEMDDVDVLKVRAADQTGYRVDDQRLDFYGVCPRCQQAAG